jgi:hypothetical protein
MRHHLMIGTWTPPGAIFTVEFDDEAWTLSLVKRTSIPTDEPISWMTFDVRTSERSRAHPEICSADNSPRSSMHGEISTALR